MGSAKQKRRKKIDKAWAEFQSHHELSDDDVKLARQIGYPVNRLQSLLDAEGSDKSRSVSLRIQDIHREWERRIEARKTAIEAGLIEPKK